MALPQSESTQQSAQFKIFKQKTQIITGHDFACLVCLLRSVKHCGIDTDKVTSMQILFLCKLPYKVLALTLCVYIHKSTYVSLKEHSESQEIRIPPMWKKAYGARIKNNVY